MTAIDKITASSVVPSDIIDKINELVDKANELETNQDGNWTKVTSGGTLFDNLSLHYSSDYTHALTGILPNDSNLYDMLVSVRITPDATTGRLSYCRANIAIDGDPTKLRLGVNGLFMGAIRNRTGNADYIEGCGLMYAKRSDKLWISRSDSIYGNLLFSVLAYRKVR